MVVAVLLAGVLLVLAEVFEEAVSVDVSTAVALLSVRAFTALSIESEASDEASEPPPPAAAAAANTAKPIPAALMMPTLLLLLPSPIPTSLASGKSLAGTSVAVLPSAAA